MRTIVDVIRRAIRNALAHDRSGAWMRFAGVVESGDPNSSQSIDEVVYGSRG